MAYDDDQTGSPLTRKRLGPNGLPMVSQYGAAGTTQDDAAAQDELNKTLADVNDPNSRNSPLAPVPKRSAYDYGQQTRATLAKAAATAGQGITALTRSSIAPITDVAAPIANFSRGLLNVPENA